MTKGVTIVGDVGGTNCRFAIAETNALGTIELHHTEIYPVKSFDSFYDAMAAYMNKTGMKPASAAFAFAGPKFDGSIKMTNANWMVSETELQTKFSLSHAVLLNDFAAMANGARIIPDDGFQIIRSGKVNYSQPVAVFGPGTGLGLSLIVPGSPVSIVPTEGGHRTFAPETAQERAIDEYLRRTMDYVSCENLLSGSGLYRLYTALCEISGVPVLCTKQEEIVAAGQANPNSVARKTVQQFNSLLGAFAADTALTTGARGGIVIAGGVSRHVAPYIEESDFEARFIQRGSGSWYVKDIPVRLVKAKYVALYGAAEMALRSL